MAGISSAALPR